VFLAGSLIHIGPGLWPRHVAGFERSDLKSRSADQIVGLPVEMAPAAIATSTGLAGAASERPSVRMKGHARQREPVGFNIRRISLSAAMGSRIEHKVQLMTTLWTRRCNAKSSSFLISIA